MIIFYLIFVLYVYNTFLSIFAFIKKDEKRKITNKEEQSFTILVPCHNEEEVIFDTLHSLNQSQYKNIFIYVIADNCSDNTVSEINRFKETYKTKNVEVIEVKGGSKPKAISLAVEYLKENNKWVNDNISIIDADNRISPSLYTEFNKQHKLGYKILQAKIVSHNDTNFIAKGFTSSFNTMTEAFQYARNVIGLSASLSGTGFSIDRFVWDDVGFENCESLTEDLEFSVLSILKGYKIRFIMSEYVLNQNLEEFIPSLVQRLRWARGYMQVSVRLSFTLVRAFVKRPSLQIFDTFVFINTPPRILIYAVSNFYFLVNDNYIPRWAILILLVYNTFFIIYANGYKIKYIIPHIFFAICTSFVIIYAVFTYKNTKWKKTKHKKID